MGTIAVDGVNPERAWYKRNFNEIDRKREMIESTAALVRKIQPGKRLDLNPRYVTIFQI